MMGLFVGGLIVSILLVVAVCMVWRRVTTKVTQEDTVEVVQLSSEERQFWRWFNEQVRTAKEYEEFLAFSLHMNLELEVFLILKKDFKGFSAWIITSSPEAIKSIGLRPSRKIQIYNGSLECRYLKFELYDGSKKASKNPDTMTRR